MPAARGKDGIVQIAPVPIQSQDSNIVVSPKNVIALQLGEIVQAEVLTVTDTMVAVRMKSTILEARTNLQLKEGEVLSLAVEEAGQQIRLRVVPSEEQPAGAIRSTIMTALAALKDLKPAAGDLKVLSWFIGHASQGLKEQLPELTALERLLPAFDGLSGPALKKAVQDSGVFFEAKLRLLAAGAQDGLIHRPLLAASVRDDLKAALLQLRESLQNDDVARRLAQSGVGADKILDAVGNLLKNTELLQLQSRLSDTLQVFVPFVWQELKDGELIFRESERDRQGEASCSCTINLDLERAGKVSARVLLQAGRVYVDILAENAEFSRILQDNSDALRNRLGTAGIRLGELTFRRESVIESAPGLAGGFSLRV